jgi:hypothetical protein
VDEAGWAVAGGRAPVLSGYVVVGRLGKGSSIWLAEETASGRGAGRAGRRVGCLRGAARGAVG